MNIYIKKDFILEGLKDYNFKYIKNDKKEVYSNNGIEVDIETRQVKSTSKCDLYTIIKLYNDNLLEIK